MVPACKSLPPNLLSHITIYKHRLFLCNQYERLSIADDSSRYTLLLRLRFRHDHSTYQPMRISIRTCNLQPVSTDAYHQTCQDSAAAQHCCRVPLGPVFEVAPTQPRVEFPLSQGRAAPCRPRYSLGKGDNNKNILSTWKKTCWP